MKSFTQNPIDLRLEALKKKEMMEHQHIISGHHKEMQDLRDALKFSQERCESLAKKNEQDLNDFKNEINHALFDTRRNMYAKDENIKDHKNGLNSLHNQIQDLHNFFASKSDLEKSYKILENKIYESENNQNNANKTLHSFVKKNIGDVKDQINENHFDIEQKYLALNEKMTTALSTSKLDKEGVLKEIRIYERSMFIIEKKIENLYTLIERINKRSDPCPKPA